jgi:hypothetical protein
MTGDDLVGLLTHAFERAAERLREHTTVDADAPEAAGDHAADTQLMPAPGTCEVAVRDRMPALGTVGHIVGAASLCRVLSRLHNTMGF